LTNKHRHLTAKRWQGNNSEANTVTTQRKPWQGQFLTTNSLARSKYLTNKRGYLTAAASFKLSSPAPIKVYRGWVSSSPIKRANTMSTITVDLTIKVKNKFTSSNI